MFSMTLIMPELMLESLDDEEFADEYDQKRVSDWGQNQAEEYFLSDEVDDVWEDVTRDFFTTLFQDLDRQ